MFVPCLGLFTQFYLRLVATSRFDGEACLLACVTPHCVWHSLVFFLFRALTSTLGDFYILIIKALLQALGDRKGINRFGDFSAPLDEALIHVSLVSDNLMGILILFQGSHVCCQIFSV